jgi:hypothetical protein
MANRPPLRSSGRVASSHHPTREAPANDPIALRPSTRANKALFLTKTSPKSGNKTVVDGNFVKTRAVAARFAVTHPVARAAVAQQQHPRRSAISHRTSQQLGKNSASLDARGNNIVNPRKRNFDALNTGSASRLPNGARMEDGSEPIDAAGEHAHATRTTHNTAHPSGINAQYLVSSRIEKSADASNAEDKRTLRSKAGGNRLKSDLAIYFPNFEDVITGVPREPGINCTVQLVFKSD